MVVEVRAHDLHIDREAAVAHAHRRRQVRKPRRNEPGEEVEVAPVDPADLDPPLPLSGRVGSQREGASGAGSRRSPRATWPTCHASGVATRCRRASCGAVRYSLVHPPGWVSSDLERAEAIASAAADPPDEPPGVRSTAVWILGGAAHLVVTLDVAGADRELTRSVSEVGGSARGPVSPDREAVGRDRSRGFRGTSTRPRRTTCCREQHQPRSGVVPSRRWSRDRSV